MSAPYALLRERLGLPETADEEEIEEAAFDVLREREDPALRRVKIALELDPRMSEDEVFWWILARIRFPTRPDLWKCETSPTS
jgi:hypothetical protein